MLYCKFKSTDKQPNTQLQPLPVPINVTNQMSIINSNFSICHCNDSAIFGYEIKRVTISYQNPSQHLFYCVSTFCRILISVKWWKWWKLRLRIWRKRKHMATQKYKHKKVVKTFFFQPNTRIDWVTRCVLNESNGICESGMCRWV